MHIGLGLVVPDMFCFALLCFDCLGYAETVAGPSTGFPAGEELIQNPQNKCSTVCLEIKLFQLSARPDYWMNIFWKLFNQNNFQESDPGSE